MKVGSSHNPGTGPVPLTLESVSGCKIPHKRTEESWTWSDSEKYESFRESSAVVLSKPETAAFLSLRLSRRLSEAAAAHPLLPILSMLMAAFLRYSSF